MNTLLLKSTGRKLLLRLPFTAQNAGLHHGANVNHNRAVRWLSLALIACALAPLVKLAAAPRVPTTAAAKAAPEWPQTWEGQAIRPLATTAVEQRFAARFPGAIARFADEQNRVLVLRHVTQPTRMLHPATDCFKGLGFRISNTRLERMATTPVPQEAPDTTQQPAQLKRCFEAERDGERLRVCERIVGDDGSAFTDASAWFWAASLGQSRGPWQAITEVEAL